MDNERFPQGDTEYYVNDICFQTLWMTATYSRKTLADGIKRVCQYCAGVYVCPVEGCNCVKNAIPSRTRQKFCLPKGVAGDGMCPVHQVKFVHSPCNVTMYLERDDKGTQVRHSGNHAHPRPHEKNIKQQKIN